MTDPAPRRVKGALYGTLLLEQLRHRWVVDELLCSTGLATSIDRQTEFFV
jgi:hypothetical protein